MANPTDILNIAEAGITTGNNWGTKYPTLSVTFVSQADYLALHEVLRTDVVTQKANESNRTLQYAALKTTNAKIAAAQKYLKGYIAEQYDTANAKTYYTAYGIEKKGNAYGIPVDNDQRMRALDAMIATLSQTGNPFKTKKYGLTFWTALRDAHRTAWTQCKNIDGTRSVLSAAIKANKVLALSYQSRLRQQIKVNEPISYKNIWRDLGFQAEKY